MTATNTAFVVLDAIAIVLVLVPMSWNLTAWNTSTCLLMLWVTIGCIIALVNSIVWAGNLRNPAPVYCDISTKIIIGITIALPLASLCIYRRLFNIMRFKQNKITRQDKVRDAIIDIIIAVGGPIIFMAIHYTMQGHRYDIIEDYGCWPSTYGTAWAYVLVLSPPIVVSVISLVYCGFCIVLVYKRRSSINEVMRSSSAVTSANYFRLMALASTDIVIGLPISLYYFITNLVSYGVQPWVSWQVTHENFSHINYYPIIFLQFNRSVLVSFEIHRWTLVFLAFNFFAFFGLTQEARNHYWHAYYVIAKPFGVRPPPQAAGKDERSKLGKYFEKRATRVSSWAETVTLPHPVKHAAPVKKASANSLADYELSMPTIDLSLLEDDKPTERLTRGSLGPQPPTPSQRGLCPAPETDIDIENVYATGALHYGVQKEVHQVDHIV